MVKGRVPPAVAQVVLNHHQQYCGKGYPERVDNRTGEQMGPMKGKQIPVFSRIATVVDVYDAATSTRVYQAAKLPVQALFEMRTACSGYFDPEIVRAFYEIIPPFPIGQIVTLSNGVEAVVVDFNSKHPERPKVQGLRAPTGERYPDPGMEEIDLALYPDLEIASVDGVDVRPFQTAHQAPEKAASLATV
jgi:HD-GYP domain-containing protein (c-di-GMP phosphodiesterase class II)